MKFKQNKPNLFIGWSIILYAIEIDSLTINYIESFRILIFIERDRQKISI